MGYGTYGRTNAPQLRCLDSTRPGADRHPGAYVRAAPVEAAVLDWLRDQAAAVEAATDVQLAHDAHTVRRRSDAKSLARQIVALDQAIGRLTANHAKGLVPDVAYTAGLDELTRERRQLEQRRVLAVADAAAGAPSVAAAALLVDWDVLPVEHRRAGLRRLIERVTVDGSTAPIGVDVTPGDIR